MMAGSSTRVAVIIPCFNEGELVAEAVHSIDETEPVEVVVVDDASTDGATRECLDRLVDRGTRVIRHDRNRGLIAARMTGLAETEAPYVFPLDGDDLAVSGSLRLMADRLEADTAAAVCYGDYEEFGTQTAIRPVPRRLDPYRLAYTNEYPVSALFRRRVLDAVGGWAARGFREPAYEDWNLWLTLAEEGLTGAHAGHDVLTFRKRFHPDRMLDARRYGLRGDHRRIYATLRALHPGVFAELRRHRGESDLSIPRRVLYPIVYGGRPRLKLERRIKLTLDRVGVWTLRR